MKILKKKIPLYFSFYSNLNQFNKYIKNCITQNLVIVTFEKTKYQKLFIIILIFTIIIYFIIISSEKYMCYDTNIHSKGYPKLIIFFEKNNILFKLITSQANLNSKKISSY